MSYKARDFAGPAGIMDDMYTMFRLHIYSGQKPGEGQRAESNPQESVPVISACVHWGKSTRQVFEEQDWWHIRKPRVHAESMAS